MYETDFCGWTRTPEEIKYLQEHPWDRFKFHWERVYKSIRYRKFQYLKWSLKDLLSNSKYI